MPIYPCLILMRVDCTQENGTCGRAHPQQLEPARRDGLAGPMGGSFFPAALPPAAASSLRPPYYASSPGDPVPQGYQGRLASIAGTTSSQSGLVDDSSSPGAVAVTTSCPLPPCQKRGVFLLLLHDTAPWWMLTKESFGWGIGGGRRPRSARRVQRRDGVCVPCNGNDYRSDAGCRV